MHTRLADKLNHVLERFFPEKRLFLRSEEGTRYFRLTPLGQLAAWSGSLVLVGWSIIATAILLMDYIGSGNLREQAARDMAMYEERLQVLALERDARAAEATAAQQRFNLALAQVSEMQERLLASEERRRELETGINVIQATLRRTMRERDSARAALELARAEQPATPPRAPRDPETEQTLDFLAEALEATAAERDSMAASAAEAEEFARAMIFEQRLRDERNDRIFQQLEDAVSISLAPMDRMFRATGMSVEQILDQIRQGYSGQGGPLTPLVMSSMNDTPDPDVIRANMILDQIDRVNLYRIAAEKLPFSMPVKAAFRYTSGFGMRWGRMHKGTDMAAPTGTPVYATADGVVVHAGWSQGYGRLIRIRHEFGIETYYAHLSAIGVAKGQRVSRGERIGAMGNSGRSTGSHLHYEIRVNGKAINAMTYIKAGRNVF